MTELKQLSISDIEQIKAFFADVFTREPWNDDWSDKNQLHLYISNLIGNSNSLTLALFENGEMVGLAIGNKRYWYAGTEYYIDELCIKTSEQGRGLGKSFIEEIEKFLVSIDVHHIFLQTERTVPAYEFYKKLGFWELKDHVSFGKDIDVV